MPTPKYADYVGSPLEELASREKESSERSVALLRQCAQELKGQGVPCPMTRICDETYPDFPVAILTEDNQNNGPPQGSYA